MHVVCCVHSILFKIIWIGRFFDLVLYDTKLSVGMSCPSHHLVCEMVWACLTDSHINQTLIMIINFKLGMYAPNCLNLIIYELLGYILGIVFGLPTMVTRKPSFLLFSFYLITLCHVCYTTLTLATNDHNHGFLNSFICLRNEWHSNFCFLKPTKVRVAMQETICESWMEYHISIIG